MIKRSWLALALLIVFSVSAPRAANDREIKHEKREVRQDKRDIAQTRALQEKLTDALDMWHTAWLKSDHRQLRGLRQNIMLALIDDVKRSQARLRRHESESRRSHLRAREHESKDPSCRDEANDDLADVQRVNELIKSKTRLLQALDNTESFNLQYRLLGDYLGLLRRELGMAQLELAEDVSELREDRRARP